MTITVEKAHLDIFLQWDAYESIAAVEVRGKTAQIRPQDARAVMYFNRLNYYSPRVVHFKHKVNPRHLYTHSIHTTYSLTLTLTHTHTDVKNICWLKAYETQGLSK